MVLADVSVIGIDLSWSVLIFIFLNESFVPSLLNRVSTCCQQGNNRSLAYYYRSTLYRNCSDDVRKSK